MYFGMQWMCFNESYHNYSLPRPHYTDDIFRVNGSQVEITDICQKCTFLSEVYRSTIHH